MRIGSLFSGYGGLDLAVEAFHRGRTVWHAEIDPAMSRVLAARWPGVPNLGDVTRVDWSAVEPVDVLCGGSPCQDVSSAGKRAGMRAGTRSGLWASMVDAIDALRPGRVVWENVRGVLSAEADSALEPCAGCVGDGDDGPVLRALGRVLGDLADLGYDAQWCGLRAADVGAPHGRFRVFVVATDTEPQHGGSRRGGTGITRWAHAEPAGRSGVPAADADDTGSQEGEPAAGRHLPARRADSGEYDCPGCGDIFGEHHYPGYTCPAADTDGYALRVEPVGECRGGRAAIAGHPRADAPADADRERLRGVARAQAGRHTLRADERHDTDRRDPVAWGQYEPAIRRWERTLGRVAPAPTERGAKGGQRLSPRFVEWMMGLPAGWVTGLPISRNEQLKGLGNGVVPQQAFEALVRLAVACERAA